MRRRSRSLALGLLSSCLALRCLPEDGAQGSSEAGNHNKQETEDSDDGEPASDASDSEGSESRGATNDESQDSASSDPSGHDEDDDGDDTDADPCALPEHIDGIQFEPFAQLSHDAQRIVSAGSQLVSCGQGFITLHDANGHGDQLEFEEAAECRGLSFDGDAKLLVASDTALYLIQVTPSLSILDRVELPSRRVPGSPRRSVSLSQLGPYEVLAVGTRGYLAMGAAGLFELSLADGELTIVGDLPAAVEPRGLALSDAGLLVAEGSSGLRLLDPEDGSELDHIALDFGFAHALDIRAREDGSLLVALARMGWGVQLVEIEAHRLGLLANKVPHGATTRVRFYGDDLVTSNLSKLVRYKIDADGQVLTPQAFQARGGRGQLAEAWLTDLVLHSRPDAGAQPELYALEGDQIHRVILPRLDEQHLAPQIRVDDAGFSLWPEDRNDDTDGLILLHNAGPGELILTDIKAPAPFEVAFDRDLEPRPGCPDQWLVPAGHGFLVEVDVDPDHEGHATGELRVQSSDPDDRVFTMSLEFDRPGPKVGDPAPDFGLVTSDGARLRLADHIGKVFFLKPLTFS